eukprot:169202-Prorocentrum_minimum.AAC.1
MLCEVLPRWRPSGTRPPASSRHNGALHSATSGLPAHICARQRVDLVFVGTAGSRFARELALTRSVIHKSKQTRERKCAHRPLPTQGDAAACLGEHRPADLRPERGANSRVRGANPSAGETKRPFGEASRRAASLRTS